MKCFLEGFLEGTCKRFSKDKVLRRERFIEGAEKVLSVLSTSDNELVAQGVLEMN